MYKLNKTQNTAIFITVLLLASAILTIMPSLPVTAQPSATQPTGGALPSGVTPDARIETISHLSLRPDPVGLGQTFLVNVWLQPPVHAQRMFNDAFTVTITKPDETTDVIGKVFV